ncbi:MAG: SMC-Scp complex subunit ScpB [Deltaproteobacteria bacterium]|nr:SMC-Scp complex subunit ScpB [Deltaproteobacteria bacterium]MBI4374798.1 SMC-Scp complex subunit ScpB [Deltaproteobacteria bacterium]
MSETGLNLKNVVEALLFAAGRSVTAKEIENILEAATPRIPGRRAEIEEAIDLLTREWEERGGGVRVVRVAGGVEFRTTPEMAPWVSLLFPAKPQRLSTPAVESLALIAYRQPITRNEIEDLRGVDSSGILKTLVEKKLVRIVGRKEEPGRPLLYATSREFLELFELKDLNDLPPLAELEAKAEGLREVGGTPESLGLSDLAESQVDLSDLDEKDREILGGLERSLEELKSVEKEVLKPEEGAE